MVTRADWVRIDLIVCVAMTLAVVTSLTLHTRENRRLRKECVALQRELEEGPMVPGVVQVELVKLNELMLEVQSEHKKMHAKVLAGIPHPHVVEAILDK